MRFQNTPASVPTISDPFNGFTPPSGPQMVFGQDAHGRPIVLQDANAYNPQQAYEADFQRFQQLLRDFDWYYLYRNDPRVQHQGYLTEQEIENLVRRHGGVFSTIWQTERSRHLVNTF